MEIVVIQARTNSSRLPGKALLTIKGIPMVLLVAKRASNTGINTLIVTSEEPSDDYLCDLLFSNKISYYRGNLNNTLNRFVSALKEYEDDTKVIRLTADNIVPDGTFIKEMLRYFNDSDLQYLTSTDERSGLPYGLSAEIFYLSDLREAEKESKTDFDLEHVTPYLRRKFGVYVFDKYQSMSMNHYRTTIDTIDDYMNMQEIFKKIDNPIEIGFKEIIDKLKYSSFAPLCNHPSQKLVLGTAQFGMNYGVNNSIGKPNQTVITNIIKSAIKNGIENIDTANAYDESESTIGCALSNGLISRINVITKLSVLDEVKFDTSPNIVKKLVSESIHKSLVSLRTNKLYCILLHRFNHLTDLNGIIWKEVLQFKENNKVMHLGVSVQTPEELIQALDITDVEIIQLPFNLLDSRWKQAILLIKAAKKKRHLIIHARSALLQGLFVTRDSKKWVQAHILNFKEVWEWMDSICKNYNLNFAELCLKYVKSQEWIDGVVVGMESLDQLVMNIKYFSEPDLNYIQKSSIDSSKPILMEKSLNPFFWSS